MVEQLWITSERFSHRSTGSASEFVLPRLLQACYHLVELWIIAIRDLDLADITQAKDSNPQCQRNFLAWLTFSSFSSSVAASGALCSSRRR